MATTITQWIIELIDRITGPIDDITDAADDATESIDDITEAAEEAREEIEKLSAVDLKATAEAIKDIVGQFDDLMNPGLDFEVQMKNVQSITQMTDDEMSKLGDSARQLAKDFGGDASAQLQSFGSIIAQFGPAIAEDNEAMATMGHNVSTLSKLMENDAVGAMDALTTSMLQFGVDLTNPQHAAAEMTRMMHVMAAAGNEGASEVADTSAALKNAGIAAKNANLSFEETNAALQALAQAGSKGSEAGVGLRNVLGKMGGIDIIPRKAQEKLHQLGVNYDIVSDKTLPFVTRLRELKKAQGDATLIAQIFGIENEKSAMALLNCIEDQEEMTQTITGTTAAYESAGIVMSSQREKMARMSAWLDDLKIGFFNVAGGITPFVKGLGITAFTVANMASAVTGIKQLITFIRGLSVVTSIQTAKQWLLNIAMNANPVGLIITGIAALITIIAVAINYYDDFGATLLFLMGPVGLLINGIMAIYRNWESVVDAFESDGIVGAINRIGVVLIDAVLYPLQKILESLSDIPGIGEYIGRGAEKLAGFRDGLNLYSPEKAPANTGSGGGNETVGPLETFLSGGKTGAGSGNTSSGKGGKGGKGSKDGVTLGGSGSSGGGKQITVNITNNFTGFKGTKEMAEAVANEFNNRLSDSLAIVG
ncbi:MAG: phage tail tape measure protein [Dysgonomonas sp.]|nr:phage tail tape measure protein [Dysgonomonas sp.]